MLAILHIGVEKTGTTSIQKFLGLNRQILSTRSILFPQAPGRWNHTNLAGYAAADEKCDDIRINLGIKSHDELLRFREQFAADFDRELRDSACDTVILSGEHCSSRLVTREEVERLHRLLSRIFEAVRVVVYLRRQDEFLLSTYSTAVKNGRTQKLSIPKTDNQMQRYDFAKILDVWSDVFGRKAMDVRLFDRSTMIGGSAVTDFIHAADLPTDLLYEMPAEENRSLDNAALEVLRLMNKHIPHVKDGNIFLPRGDLPILFEAISSGASIMIEPTLLNEFMRSLADSNRKVAREYFGRESAEGDPLFGLLSELRDREMPEPLSIRKATEIFAKLWIMKQSQIDALKQRGAKRDAT